MGLMKEACQKDIKISSSPLIFWDYIVERRAAILSLTARYLLQLQGSNTHTATSCGEGVHYAQRWSLVSDDGLYV